MFLSPRTSEHIATRRGWSGTKLTCLSSLFCSVLMTQKSVHCDPPSPSQRRDIRYVRIELSIYWAAQRDSGSMCRGGVAGGGAVSFIKRSVASKAGDGKCIELYTF